MCDPTVQVLDAIGIGRSVARFFPSKLLAMETRANEGELYADANVRNHMLMLDNLFNICRAHVLSGEPVGSGHRMEEKGLTLNGF